MSTHSPDAPTGYPETADIETASDDYASRFAGEVGKWFLQVQSQITLQMVESCFKQLPCAAHPGLTVLDVGGGHGQLAPVLIENGYKVTVTGSAASCQERLQSLIDDRLCSFRVANILELPYADRSFDVVTSFRLVPHVDRWQSLLVELARVARHAVIIDYPTIKSVNFLAPHLFFLKKGVEGNTRTFRCFEDEQVSDAFAAAGFSLAQRAPEFFFPMALHRVLNRPHLSAAAERISSQLGLTEHFGSPVIAKYRRDR